MSTCASNTFIKIYVKKSFRGTLLQLYYKIETRIPASKILCTGTTVPSSSKNLNTH